MKNIEKKKIRISRKEFEKLNRLSTWGLITFVGGCISAFALVVLFGITFVSNMDSFFTTSENYVHISETAPTAMMWIFILLALCAIFFATFGILIATYKEKTRR